MYDAFMCLSSGTSSLSRSVWFCLLLIALAASPGLAEDITWVTSSPGTSARETMDSGMLAYLTRNLPDFSHHILRVSAARAYHELQHGAGICKADVIVTPEREELYAFVSRRREVPGFRLLVRKDRLSLLAPAMSGRDEVDLGRMSAVKGLNGGFTVSRRYDPVIAEFIQNQGNAAMDSMVATFQLFNLLQAGRIDYTFVLPMDFYYYQDKALREEMLLLRVKDAAPIVHAGVACSPEPVGRRAVAAMDALLADDAHWEEFVEPIRKWLPPEDFARLEAGH